MNLSTRNFRYWLTAVLWLAVIALESFRLSSAVTGTYLWELLRGLHIHISWNTFDKFHHFLRKAGHVTGYGILCLLLFRAWYHTLAHGAGRRLRLRCSAFALGMTLLTAVLDEWHQSFNPARTASIRDVGLDAIGGMIFLAVALFVFRTWPSVPAAELETISV